MSKGILNYAMLVIFSRTDKQKDFNTLAKCMVLSSTTVRYANDVFSEDRSVGGIKNARLVMRHLETLIR